ENPPGAEGRNHDSRAAASDSESSGPRTAAKRAGSRGGEAEGGDRTRQAAERDRPGEAGWIDVGGSCGTPPGVDGKRSESDGRCGCRRTGLSRSGRGGCCWNTPVEEEPGQCADCGPDEAV